MALNDRSWEYASALHNDDLLVGVTGTCCVDRRTIWMTDCLDVKYGDTGWLGVDGGAGLLGGYGGAGLPGGYVDAGLLGIYGDAGWVNDLLVMDDPNARLAS